MMDLFFQDYFTAFRCYFLKNSLIGVDRVLNTPLKLFDKFLQNTKYKIYDKQRKQKKT